MGIATRQKRLRVQDLRFTEKEMDKNMEKVELAFYSDFWGFGFKVHGEGNGQEYGKGGTGILQ